MIFSGFILTFHFHQLAPIVCDRSMCHDQLENKLITVSYCYTQRRGFMLFRKTKEKVQNNAFVFRESSHAERRLNNNILRLSFG